jgi:hypothetical protein
MFSACSARDVFGGCVLIVVSHDGPETVRRGHPAQQASTRFGGRRGFFLVSREGNGNEISREHNQIGMKVVNQGYGGMQRMDGKIRVVMEIAKQRDGEAIHPFWPARQEKVLAYDARTVGLEEDSVSGNGDCASSGGGAKKLASCSWDQRQTRIMPWASTASRMRSYSITEVMKRVQKTANLMLRERST